MTLRVLLDTHAFLWWIADSSRLSTTAYNAISQSENSVFVSAATAWEIAIKYRLGKLPEAQAMNYDIVSTIAYQGFSQLPITVQHAHRAGSLHGHHRDPFDRILIAQAMSENLVFISNESLFDRYGVHRLW